MRPLHLGSGVILMFLVFSVQAENQLSNIELYKRCSIHISNQPPKLNGEVENAIKSGAKDPIRACIELLEKGMLDGSGRLKEDTKIGRSILRTFTQFHRTWFTANTLEQIQDYSEEIARGTVDLYDPNEPALTLSRALLGDAVSYKQVLTGNAGIQAIRQDDPKLVAKYGFTTTNAWRRFGTQISETSQVTTRNIGGGWVQEVTDRTAADFVNVPLIQLGDLVGIAPTTQSTILNNIEFAPVGGIGSHPGHIRPELNFQYDFFKHRGGGILGSNTFFLLNYGHPLGLNSNGTTKLPRRWIQSAMESLLCSTFPALRENDIKNFVKTNSSTPFRNASSCVQCHATLDQAATTARNLIVGATDYSNLTKKNEAGENVDIFNRHPLVVTDYKISKPPASSWLAEPDATFHLQNPTGELFFRSFTGALVSKRVANIADLGRAMEETDDFYACAAKRYFKYFTGVDVSLFDKTNPANSSVIRSLSPLDHEYRAFVESLGSDLKKSQSSFEMVKKIIASPYYRKTQQTRSAGGE